ncbi:hypothetical protein FB451DRAFT_1081737 [Mycena latifolia]|nr:hypothetical protein FB451DRAFT_1081737 [Mycena latifolia]
MFFKALTFFALGTLGIAFAEPSSQIPMLSGLNTEASGPAQDATVFSLIYGMPLAQYVPFANSIANMSGGHWTTNSLLHSTSLVDASYRTVVMPNVDTLYSQGLIDLSTADLVATMPDMEPGRFYVCPFYDLYGNNFCNIGSATKSVAGKYLITYRPAQPRCVLDPSQGYAGIIYMPTAYGFDLLRIEVDNSTDIDHVVNYIQPSFTLTAQPALRPQLAPPLSEALLNDGLTVSNLPLYIMQLTARLSPFNPPEDAQDIPWVHSVLQMAGISMGTYSEPAGVYLTLAFEAAQAQVLQADVGPQYVRSLGNGWTALRPKLAGDYHSHFVVRAFVAYKEYMLLTETEALYPTYDPTQTFFANQSYMVTFYGKPQVDAFWSLTMYDDQGYLVPNALNRYSLNNRGNMTYPQGGLVRHSPADSSTNFYMLLQSTDYPASAQWESNWLPTPADGKAFSFTLRLYVPQQSLLDGTYTYPKVEPVTINPPLPVDI